MESYVGLALTGRKGNGKDTVLDLFRATRPNVVVLRSKTPIVEAYEQHVGRTYDKARDDADLIAYSREVVRRDNPMIVADWLRRRIPEVVAAGKLPVVPDLRFPDELAALRDCRMLIVKVDASEHTRRARITARDGGLHNYRPDDITESQIDRLAYDLRVDNDGEDLGLYAASALERYLANAGNAVSALRMPTRA